MIGINGAAARLVQPGDLVIIISYAQLSDAEARDVRPAGSSTSTRANKIIASATTRPPPSPGPRPTRGDLAADPRGRARTA